VVGGILIATLGWRAIFFINVPLGAAGLWLTRRFVTETPKLTERRIDLGGAVAAVTALGAFAGAAIEAGPLGFSSPWVLAGLAVSLLATGAFIWVEAHTANPMLPLALLRQRRFASPIAVGSLVNICFYGLIFVFSLLFQDQHHLSALQAGIAFVPMTAAILATNLVNGKLAAFIGPVRMILLGAAAMTAGCAGLLWTGPGTPYPAMLGQQVLLGAGLGLLVPPMTGLLLASTDRSRSGVASGALTAFRQAGSLLGVALFGSLIAGRHLFYQGLHIALWISIAALVASAAFALLASGPKRDATSVSPGRTVVDPVVEEPAK
jgi:DHA2 family methylenomycin A resistance protein-like MFS transporter